jgi:hypothetical protein
MFYVELVTDGQGYSTQHGWNADHLLVGLLGSITTVRPR